MITMRVKIRQGQSTVEYILLVTAVISVIMFATMGRNSVFQQRLSDTVTTTSDGMQSLANQLANMANAH